jgi:hypothetical protein
VAAIPARLGEAERLRAKAEGETVPATDTASRGRLPAFSFDALSVVLERGPPGEVRLRVVGRCPELGLLTGGGRRHADGTIKIALAFRRIPSSTLQRNPVLSDALLEAVAALGEDGPGLRLDLVLPPEGPPEAEARYVQDVFRRVMERTAGARAAAGKKAKAPARDGEKKGEASGKRQERTEGGGSAPRPERPGGTEDGTR